MKKEIIILIVLAAFVIGYLTAWATISIQSNVEQSDFRDCINTANYYADLLNNQSNCKSFNVLPMYPILNLSLIEGG